METKVKINVNDVVKFCKILNKHNVEFDIMSQRNVVDGKSILGLCSLDLNKPLILNILTDNEKTINHIKNEIKEYLI